MRTRIFSIIVFCFVVAVALGQQPTQATGVCMTQSPDGVRKHYVCETGQVVSVEYTEAHLRRESERNLGITTFSQFVSRTGGEGVVVVDPLNHDRARGSQTRRGQLNRMVYIYDHPQFASRAPAATVNSIAQMELQSALKSRGLNVLAAGTGPGSALLASMAKEQNRGRHAGAHGPHTAETPRFAAAISIAVTDEELSGGAFDGRQTAQVVRRTGSRSGSRTTRTVTGAAADTLGKIQSENARRRVNLQVQVDFVDLKTEQVLLSLQGEGRMDTREFRHINVGGVQTVAIRHHAGVELLADAIAAALQDPPAKN